MKKAEKRNITDYKIKSSACDVFSEYGYSNARIASIAERAEVSNGLIIQNFGSKMNLYRCIVDDCCEFVRNMYSFEDCKGLRECLSKLVSYFHDGIRNEKTRKVLNFFCTASTGRDTPDYYKIRTSSLFGSGEVIKYLEKEQSEGTVIQGNPADVYGMFLITTAWVTELAYESNLEMPPDDWFIKLIMQE